MRPPADGFDRGPGADFITVRNLRPVETVSNHDPFEDLDVPDPLSDLDRSTQRLTVRTDERRYGKKMVVIEGFDPDADLKSLASTLKSALGTGGTVKEGRIEIQGDHAGRVRELLEENGYTVE